MSLCIKIKKIFLFLLFILLSKGIVLAQYMEHPVTEELFPENEPVLDTIYVAKNLSVDLQEVARRITSWAITSRFPTARLFDIQIESVLPVSYQTKLYGEDYEKGRYTHQNRIRVAVNLPFIRKKNWISTVAFRYKYENTGFSDIENVSLKYPQVHHDDPLKSHFYVGSLINTYLSILFNKPVAYNLILLGEGSQHGLERVSGIVLANMILKKNDRTALTVGLAGFINSRLRIPVLPVFSFDYSFTDGWAFSSVLPAFIYMRKTFDRNGRLSLGSEFNSNNFYLYPEPGNYLFNKTEIRPGIMYEHYIHDKIILTCKTGLLYVLQGQLIPENKTSADKILKSKEHITGYWNIGFSYSFF
ncbi:MAG: DUF6268 family outer membrane beta-barrel protein [Candidatus Azobacteroides sp.]|nr:DUF6268 family outer membrane beta-barrel protein [Candidatus Azobacteroides sp.]